MIEAMPTVARFRRCRIEMYFADHKPPHFHVITSSDERVAIVIETLTIMAGEAKAKDIAEAIEWATANRAELIRRWKLYTETE